jgi:hypothetical protein
MFKSTTSAKRAAVLAAASLALAAVPVTLAGPAQAAVPSIFACSVTPLKPTFAGFSSSGQKLTDYPVRVYCTKARSLTVQHRIWEVDVPGPNQLIRDSYNSFFLGAGQAVTLHNVRPPINTEWGSEEVFHQARHREGPSSILPLWSGWKSTSIFIMP